LNAADCNVLGITGRLCAKDVNGVYYCADPGEVTNGTITIAPPPGAPTSTPVVEPDGGLSAVVAALAQGALIATNIGASGGVVGADGVTVSIPAGALSSDVPITIRLSAAPGPDGTVSPVFEIGPTGTQFAEPITIAFDYTDSELGDLPPSDFTVETVADSGASWTPLSQIVVDVYAHTIAGQTAHLSPYALVEQLGGAPIDSGIESSVDASAGDATVSLVAMPAAGSCVATGSLTTARGSPIVAVLDSGKVLVAGGGSADSNFASAELYDPSTGTFAPTGSMSTPRGWGGPGTGLVSGVAKLADGRVLVVGGVDATTVTTLATAEIYDPTSGTWSPTGSMAFPRENATYVTLGNGQVLALGGWSQISGLTATGVFLVGDPLSSAEIYDPNAGTWTATGSMTTARGYAAASLLANGEVLVAAGSGSNGQDPLYSAEVFSLSSDGGTAGTFTAVGMLPTSVPIDYFYVHSFSLPDGQALITAPSTDTTLFSGGPLAVFNPMSGMFAAASADLISATQGLSLKTGDLFLIAGGDSATPTSQTEVYQATTGTWRKDGDMTEPHPYSGFAELADGNVLVIGGSDAVVDLCHP
jgi:hypothetical protein